MVQTVTDLREVGRGCSDDGSLLPWNGAGFPALLRRDLGRDSTHRVADGGILPQVGAAGIG